MLFQILTVSTAPNADWLALWHCHTGQIVVAVKLVPKAVAFIVNVFVH